jgi:hypothetical protein
MNWTKVALACLIAAAPLGAAAAQEDDILNKIINKAGSTSVSGTKAKSRNDSGVQGGKAIRVNATKGTNPWDISLNSAIDKPVKAGDKLILAFWARLEKGEGGATSGTISNASVQLAAAPYSSVFNGPVTLTPEWKLHELKGKADKDYAAGTLGVTMHLATAKQTIDFGPVFVLNMGQ